VELGGGAGGVQPEGEDAVEVAGAAIYGGDVAEEERLPEPTSMGWSGAVRRRLTDSC